MPPFDVLTFAWEAMDNVIHNAILPCLRVFNMRFYNSPFDNNTLIEGEDAKLAAALALRIRHLRHRGILDVKIITGE